MDYTYYLYIYFIWISLLETSEIRKRKMHTLFIEEALKLQDEYSITKLSSNCNYAYI